MPGSLLYRYSPVPGSSVAACCVTRYCSRGRAEMALGSFQYVGIFFFSLKRRMTRALYASRRTNRLATQRPEACANLFREDLRLFPRREVAAPVDLVVMDELGERPLSPTPRSRIELVGKDGHGDGNVDSLGVEVAELVLPVQADRWNTRARQPS